MTTHAEPVVELLDRDGNVIATGSAVIDAVTSQPLAHPPALRTEVSCKCGKRTLEAHGGFPCDEVLAIAARVNHSQLSFWRRLRTPKPAGWRLSREEIVQIIERERAQREAATR